MDYLFIEIRMAYLFMEILLYFSIVLSGLWIICAIVVLIDVIIKSYKEDKISRDEDHL